MKKHSTNVLFLATALLVAACSGGKSTTEETTATEAPEVTYSVDATQSVVAWKGEVAGVYGHNGVINIANGTVSAKGDQITGGSVTIDMTSIQPLDSASFTQEEGRRITDLVGHLSTGDFFLVETYPTANFVIKSFDGTKLTGDLTVKGKTKEVTAEVTSIATTPTTLSAEAVLVFNRQDFEVSWVHFMKDMVLSDDIEVKLSIQASL